MEYRLQNQLLQVLKSIPLKATLKNQFVSRIKKGDLTRDENPDSHVCVYFALCDSSLKLVFIGRHIKSGLWLFNGGHIDKGEVLKDTLYREMREEWGLVKKINDAPPSLFTVTKIENPKKQMCKQHYDIWYIIPFDKNKFHPKEELLSKEFFEWGWKTIDEAKSLTKDKTTLKGLNFILNQVFLLHK